MARVTRKLENLPDKPVNQKIISFSHSATAKVNKRYITWKFVFHAFVQ
jgi:hypothetical protein